MGLRRKISIWFAGVLAALAFAGYWGLTATLEPAFDDLEDRASRADLTRVRHSLDAYQQMLSRFTVDWGQWDETYRYMQGDNPSFPGANVGVDTLVGLDSNLMLIYDLAGNLDTALLVDLSSERELPLDTLGIDETVFEALRAHTSISEHISGFIRTRLGPMLVSSRPITRSDITGPSMGTFLFGRLIDKDRVTDIGFKAEVNLALTPVDDDNPSVSESRYGAVTQTIDDTVRINEQLLHDITGAAIARLRVTSSREVSTLGMNTAASVLLLFVGLGAVAMVVLALILRGVIIEPLLRLRTMMSDIEQREDVSLRVNLDREDEIGELGDSFDTMLTKLERMKKQNIEQSFKAGMAEVAAGVLHNVRNTLMPVINNVAMAREAMVRRSDSNVFLAIDEIGEADISAKRREKLLRFVKNSYERGVKNRAAAVDYLGNVLDQLDGASAILKDQEKFAHAKPVDEQIRLGEVIDAALGVIPADVRAGIDVDVSPSAQDARVEAHRVSLMQVIGNVLVNAVDSILGTKSSVGRIAIDATSTDDGERIELVIRDDGAGISPENLERLFERGYSTKDGNGGLGLHWSANALAGMGARIEAFSDGAGEGAEFRVSLRAASDGNSKQ